MNLAKWRIRKQHGKWQVLPPGARFTAVVGCDTHHDAVSMLAYAQRWAERGFR